MQIMMLAGGVVLAFIGLLIARRSFRPKSMSLATQATFGLCMAFVGYHLIVWSFPPTLTPVQVNRQFWWVVCAAVVTFPMLSFWMDRHCLSASETEDPPEAARDDLDSIR